jgi:hypothetical protein
MCDQVATHHIISTAAVAPTVERDRTESFEGSWRESQVSSSSSCSSSLSSTPAAETNAITLTIIIFFSSYSTPVTPSGSADPIFPQHCYHQHHQQEQNDSIIIVKIGSAEPPISSFSTTVGNVLSRSDICVPQMPT